MEPSTLLVLVVGAALVFAFTNGFHDTPNAIATVVSTGVLRLRSAVYLASVLTVVGAFAGTAVAHTFRSELIEPSAATPLVVLAALVGGIAWNLFTFYFGVPSSSSHALVGGLVGAAWTAGGVDAIRWGGLSRRVVLPLLATPIVGFALAFVVMVAVYWSVHKRRPVQINAVFHRLQLGSSAALAWAHGSNDAQKSIGVLTLALYGGRMGAEAPTWAIVCCALAMGFGTATGGWALLPTMRRRVFKLRAIHGCVAEAGAAAVIGVCALAGLPTSTTHTVTGTIMGAGATTRLSAVSWGVTRRIFVAWIVTLPAAAVIGALTLRLLMAVGI